MVEMCALIPCRKEFLHSIVLNLSSTILLLYSYYILYKRNIHDYASTGSTYF